MRVTRSRAGGASSSGGGTPTTPAPRVTRQTKRKKRATTSRARSVGPPATNADFDALRKELAAKSADLEAARGMIQQLEAQREDSAAAGGAVTDGSGAGVAGEEATSETPNEGARPSAYLDLTIPGGGGTSTAQVRSAAAKDFVRAWNDRSILKGWMQLAERPSVAGCKLEVVELEGVLGDEVRVTAPVRQQLNSMGSFNILDYISVGDDPTITRTNLPDHMDTFVNAIITLYDCGLSTEEGSSRLGILRQQLESGASMLRKHCLKYPSRLNDKRVFQMLADIVNDDLKTWAAKWLCAAVRFRNIYDSPPAVEHFPPVMGPQWNDLQDFIGSGGLRNIAIRQVSAAAVMSPTKRGRQSTGDGGGKGHCWKQDKPGGCRRRDCPFEHRKKADRRASNGSGTRGGPRGGSGASNRGGRGGGGSGGDGGGAGSTPDP